MLSRDYYRIQLLKVNTARVKLWAIESKREKWWTKCVLSTSAMPLSNRNSSGRMQKSWDLWNQILCQIPRTPIIRLGWGSRMYSLCPQWMKATPANLILGFICYVKSNTKQDSTHSLEYCGWSYLCNGTVVTDRAKLLRHLYFNNFELIPFR